MNKFEAITRSQFGQTSSRAQGRITRSFSLSGVAGWLAPLGLIVAGLTAMGCERSGAVSKPTPIGRESRVAVVQDLTGSMKTSRGTLVTPDDVRSVLESMGRHGGELAFASVTGDSTAPLSRVRIDPAPTPPVATSGQGDAIGNAEEAGAYQKARVAYDEKLRAWRGATSRATDTFIEQLTPVLQKGHFAQRTDLLGAIRRVELFFSEPVAVGGGDVAARLEPKTILLILSDGADTYDPGARLVLKTNPVVVLVNGVGALGIFGTVAPPVQRFESKASALDYIKKEIDRD